ncbi:docking protein 1 [Scomber scombrus]|uniref:Docking protein 1 n=1 Tax=Scomber scombrus TaxID=13677 RepID=A0AAV1ND52_SCOSC
MDVIYKEGMLYLQGVKFAKKTWRKIWLVLFKPSSTGVGRLEFYTVIDSNAITDPKKASRLRTPERKVVRLSDCLSVTPAPKESCPSRCTAFYLNTTQSTYTLASMTSQDWLSALSLLAFQKDPGESDKGDFERGNGLTMEDNDLYSSWKTELTLPPNQYQVTVQSTEASRRCKLVGDYVISPESEAVSLHAIQTGQTIYSWPYRLLRKFGQVEGGFSIEAGRRCDSGEGVFIFLSKNSPQIFQAISRQCSIEKKSSVQAFSAHRRSLCDQSPLHHSPKTNRAAGPPDFNPADTNTEDECDNHYSTINEASLFKVMHPSLVHCRLTNSKESVGKESEDEDERCHSLEAISLDDDMDDSIYYNVRRATPPIPKKQLFPVKQNTECIYSDLKLVETPLDLQLQPSSSPLPPPVPQPPPCNLPLPQSVSYAPPKPARYQRQPPASNYIQSANNTQAQPVDDRKEMEEATSSSACANPTEAPGSFKHRLAEIISKDLAKFQPPLPSGVGSPPFSL